MDNPSPPESDPRRSYAWDFEMIIRAIATRLDSVRLRSRASATRGKSRELRQEAEDLRKRRLGGGATSK
jgi:hypothetical protein